MSGEADRERRRLLVSCIITLGALVLALLHLILPSVKVDAITVTLLGIAALPWLGAVFRVIKLPGGLEVEYEELERAKREADKVGLLAAPAADGIRPVFLAVASEDPNLALAGLRIEIERRLRALAAARGLNASGQSVGSLLRTLSGEQALSPQERSVLADMIGLLNDAVHGATVDSRAATWALDVGPKLLGALDELVASQRK